MVADTDGEIYTETWKQCKELVAQLTEANAELKRLLTAGERDEEVIKNTVERRNRLEDSLNITRELLRDQTKLRIINKQTELRITNKQPDLQSTSKYGKNLILCLTFVTI